MKKIFPVLVVLCAQLMLSASARSQPLWSAATLALSVVHKGEGVESAFIRQLMANPSLCDNSKVCRPFTGNRKDVSALKTWAGHEAHVIAIKTGYFDWKFWSSIRVAAPDRMAYILERTANGGIKVIEQAVAVTTNHNQVAAVGTPPQVRIAATHISQANFIGWPGTGNRIPSYEYLSFYRD